MAFYDGKKRPERPDSGPLGQLRRVNNYVKACGLRSALANAGALRGAAVVDLGCGHGGDIAKYHMNDVRHVIFVDASQPSLDELKRRLAGWRGQLSFTYDIIRHDLRQPLDLSEKPPADVVVCNFALHYMFDSEEHATNFFWTVSSALRPERGVFVCTVPQMPLDHPGTPFMSVTPAEDDDPKRDFGRAYQFTLDGHIDETEYEVKTGVLLQVARKCPAKLRCCFAHGINQAALVYSERVLHRTATQKMLRGINLKSLPDDVSKACAFYAQYMFSQSSKGTQRSVIQ